MYREYWGLNKKPFLNTPDPEFFYLSEQHQESFSRLLYAVQEKLGAAIFTGSFGCGKTLVAKALMDELLNEKYKVAYIANPRLNDIDLLRTIIYHLGASKPPESKADVLTLLQDVLINIDRNKKETVIIIDEAHAIDDDSIFEELRLLLNYQSEDKFLLTLILIGQPELKQKIERNIQFEQRIGVKSKLQCLSLDDTKNYIKHRLSIAGREEPIFTPEALDTIFEYSGGIPRKINRICDMSLLAGYIKSVDAVDEEIILEEIKGLE